MANRPTILHQDQHLVVVNKPSGWLSIPDRNQQFSVLGWLRRQFDAIYTVHRIDRETSGILIFAKTEEAHQKLNTMFSERSIRKVYWALLHGDLKTTTEVDLSLSSAASGKVKVDKKGKSAFSSFSPTHRFGKFTASEVSIITGRTHQIRVHAKSLGHPLVGDPLYGDGQPLYINDIKRGVRNPSEVPLIKRTALHAQRLHFIHPMTQELLEVEAPLPKDLRAALKQLKKWRSPNVI